MGTQTTTFHVSYSAVPAVIIVCRDGDRTRVTPVPLSWGLVWRLLSHWLRWLWWRLKSGGCHRATAWMQRELQFRLIAPFYKIILGHVLVGTSWQRSLAWGVLGI